ncbi:hypothetical protein HanXRQr2_Chr04g0150711 [Helianthus annuus]|uniref:Uncharacterized protein n=1 Tax=Helianthus annuus TaxID=4232 RepID=A0A9K3J5P0_HELAN|nr:hypothetical protein HanXRQr2_Chr04g0150711 [Helianthus annuus]
MNVARESLNDEQRTIVAPRLRLRHSKTNLAAREMGVPYCCAYPAEEFMAEY